MVGGAVGELLPAAAAVALSPIPIVAVVLVLDGARPRRSGAAFASGWVAGLTIVSVVVVVIVGAGSDPGSDAATGIDWFMAGIGLLFLVMAARQWKKRPKRGEPVEMPGWMASISTVSPMRAVLTGAALSGANPKNLALTAAAAAAIANAELGGADTALAILAFVADRVDHRRRRGRVLSPRPRQRRRATRRRQEVHGRQQRNHHDGDTGSAWREAPRRRPRRRMELTDSGLFERTTRVTRAPDSGPPVVGVQRPACWAGGHHDEATPSHARADRAQVARGRPDAQRRCSHSCATS